MSAEESLATQGIPSEGDGLRLSFWKVGMVLLMLVVVVLGGAFALNSQLRSRVGIEPISTALPAAQAETSASAATAEARSLHQEVMDAYLRYWEVRKEAYLALDTSRLGEVMADAELAREKAQIRNLQASGRAGRLDVDHGAVVVDLTTDSAVVYDEYQNRSVYLDAVTREPLRNDVPSGVEKISYELKRFEGTWKVVDGAQH